MPLTHSEAVHILDMITVLRIPHRSVNARQDLCVNSVLDLSEGGTFKDDLSLLVALRSVDSKLIPPAEPCTTELTHDVVDQMTSGDHDTAVSLAEVDVNHAVEQPCRTCQQRQDRK